MSPTAAAQIFGVGSSRGAAGVTIFLHSRVVERLRTKRARSDSDAVGEFRCCRTALGLVSMHKLKGYLLVFPQTK